MTHALSCSTGGYPTIRHNELRDVTANLLKKVATNVANEPRLQPLTRERLQYRTAITARRVHRMSFLVSGNHLFSGNLANGKAYLLDWLSCIRVDRRAVYSTVTMSLFRSEREREWLCMQFKIHHSLFLQWRVATEKSITSSGSLLDWR